MELEHTFTVPVPEERAWEVLLDVERVAPCMPGATLDSVDGDEIKGRIKVKVGPISMTYAGTARFTERDPQAHVITLQAAGKETRGAGTASATVRSMLEARGDQTHVIVHTTLNVTGRPAQFGRGVMAEVGGKLIGIFATNLADMLTAESTAGRPAESAGAGDAEAAESSGTADDLTLPVEELHLALRSHNSLRRDGIHTVGELAARTEQQLLAIDHIGPASVDEIRQKLAERGLSLAVADSPAPAGGPGAASGGAGRQGAQPASLAADDGTAAGDTAAGDPAAGGTAARRAAPSSAAANGAAPSRAAANGESGASAAAPRPTPAAARPPDEDAIDLLSVAGLPVLKRAIPVLAGLVVAAALVLRFRLRRRRRSRS